MDINRRDLLLRRIEAGETVPYADRTRWIPGRWMNEQLATRQADAALADDLESEAGQTIDEQ
jgi:hypothetical protein